MEDSKVFRFLQFLLAAMFLGISTEAFSVSNNYQCKISAHRIIEVFSVESRGIPAVLDIQLNPEVKSPFVEAAGFQECSQGGAIDRDHERGVTGRLISLQDPALEDRMDYVLERAGTRLRNRRTGILYGCDPVPVYNSYCFCQYIEKSKPEDTTCGDSEDHFNRNALLRKNPRIVN